jgi:hypothetical protein
LTSHYICRGGADSELRDEIDAQEDARRDAEEARADGDEHPVGQTFDERAKAGTSLDVGSTGTLAEEFADKEGESEPGANLQDFA